MPNWCDNRVTISSNTEDDSQFQKLVAKFQVERPFNEIYPMPDFKTIPNKDDNFQRKKSTKTTKAKSFVKLSISQMEKTTIAGITGALTTGELNGIST